MFNIIIKNKKNILNYFVLALMLFVFVTPVFLVYAGDVGGPGQPTMKIKIENPFKEDTIVGLIETIVNEILMPIGGVVAVLMIMYAGYLYVTAQGDPGKITKAHDALKWAVIGAAILLGAWVISTAISTTIDQLRKP